VDVITLSQVFAWLRRHGLVLAVLAMFGAAAGVVVSGWLPREYRGDAVVMLLRDNSATSGLNAQLGGLAALAGISLGDGSTDEALEVLRSRSLAAKFIEHKSLLPELFPERYSGPAGGWRERAPTIAEAVDRFDRRVRTVSQDKSTGMVRVSMRSRDPARAAELANHLIQLANDEMRKRAAGEARQLLGYLVEEASRSQVLEVRQSLYRLAESQLKTLAMAKVRRDFAYRVIDPAFAPDARDYVSPSRVAFAALGLFCGTLAALMISWLRDRRRVARD
jgi:uncharacterized protein involved in exopolysaccharide biosynthesis